MIRLPTIRPEEVELVAMMGPHHMKRDTTRGMKKGQKMNRSVWNPVRRLSLPQKGWTDGWAKKHGLQFVKNGEYKFLKDGEESEFLLRRHVCGAVRIIRTEELETVICGKCFGKRGA